MIATTYRNGDKTTATIEKRPAQTKIGNDQMLSQEDNNLITHTGPGTPGGNLLRRHWHPVALVEELPRDGAPLPVRIMSEDLVLFAATTASSV